MKKLQKSIKKADGEYTIEKENGKYYLVYESKYKMQEIIEFSLKDYNYIVNATNLKLMEST